jgi:GT2 family glycosyltransferase
MINKPELSIIFVNYFTSKLLDNCLQSLLNQEYKEFCVFIVDNSNNANEFNEIIKLQMNFSKSIPIQVLKSKYNLGFAGGNNKALKLVSTPFICLLNCDTIVPQKSLCEIIEYLKNNPKIGMLCPKIMYFSDPERIWYAGAKIVPNSTYFSKHIGMNQKDKGQFDEISETAYANGAALFTRSDVVSNIGLLDEIYFMYSEETDWNFRAKNFGYKIIYYPFSRILHKVPIITSKNRLGFRKNPFQIYLYNRNRLIFILKFYNFKEILSFFIFFQFRTSVFEIIWAFIFRRVDFLIANIRSICMGLLIGFKRRYHQHCKKQIKSEMKYLKSLNKISNSNIQSLSKL